MRPVRRIAKQASGTSGRSLAPPTQTWPAGHGMLQGAFVVRLNTTFCLKLDRWSMATQVCPPVRLQPRTSPPPHSRPAPVLLAFHFRSALAARARSRRESPASRRESPRGHPPQRAFAAERPHYSEPRPHYSESDRRVVSAAPISCRLRVRLRVVCRAVIFQLVENLIAVLATHGDDSATG